MSITQDDLIERPVNIQTPPDETELRCSCSVPCAAQPVFGWPAGSAGWRCYRHAT